MKLGKSEHNKRQITLTTSSDFYRTLVFLFTIQTKNYKVFTTKTFEMKDNFLTKYFLGGNFFPGPKLSPFSRTF